MQHLGILWGYIVIFLPRSSANYEVIMSYNCVPILVCFQSISRQSAGLQFRAVLSAEWTYHDQPERSAQHCWY